MSKIIVFGDTHIRSEEPFYSAIQNFFKWCINQKWNNSENIMVHVGDLFHSNQPTPRDYELAHWALGNLKFKDIFLLAGNGIHEYNRIKKTYAIDPLTHINNIQLVREYFEYVYQGVNMLFLPWIPSSKYNISMKEKYENLKLQQDPHYIFGHFAHTEFFGTEIDISYIPGKKRMGHIHIPTNEYIGVNVISRYDEKGIDCSLIEIDTKTLKEERLSIPKFLDYKSIKYGDKIKEIDYNIIYDIIDAPSKEKAESMYEDISIRQIHIKKDDQIIDSDGNIIDSGASITQLFDSFSKEKKLNKSIVKLIKQVI